MMYYYWSNDWGRVKDVFDQYGQNLMPKPEQARLLVAEEKGQIVGFGVVQLIPHTEPVWVHPDWRGKVSLKKMLKMAEGAFQGRFYAFVPDEHLGKIVTALGFRELPWKVFRKDV